MTLEEGINKIFDGNCMLFLGSGFSLSSVNINRENLVTLTQQRRIVLIPIKSIITMQDFY